LRTEELAVTNRQLRRGVVRRKALEEAARQRGQHYQKCLAEAQQLQRGLRQLAHQVLAAQEEERKKISTELHNEIAQSLLGLNVRLLGLRQAARQNTADFKNQIAGTQRLVANSVKSVRRVAREFRNA
jgi:signal transduction histidine kinase